MPGTLTREQDRAVTVVFRMLGHAISGPDREVQKVATDAFTGLCAFLEAAGIPVVSGE